MQGRPEIYMGADLNDQNGETIHGPLMFVLCLLPLQWVNLGPLPVSQFAIMIPSFALIARQVRFVPSGPGTEIFKAYFIFVMVLVLGLFWTTDLVEGFKATARSLIYCALGYGFFTWLTVLPRQQVMHTLRRSIFYVVPSFLAVFFAYSVIAGVSIPSVLLQTVKTANPYILQYQLFVVVLNGGPVPLSEAEYSSATRHGIMLSLCVPAIVHIILRERKAFWGSSLCYLIFVLTLLSFSRSALVAAILSGLMIFACRMVRWEVNFVRVFFVIASGIVLIALLGFTSDASNIGAVLNEKFVSDVVDNERTHEFTQIVERINAKSLLGWGTGSNLDLFALEAQYPHNLVLYGWQQVGLMGLAASAIAYITVCWHSLRMMGGAVRATDPTIYRCYLLAAAMLGPPIIRMSFAKAGHLVVPEWTSIALSSYFWYFIRSENTAMTALNFEPAFNFAPVKG